MGKKGSKIPYVMLMVLALGCAGLLLYIVPYRYQLNHTVTYSESQKPLDNPLTGYAPPAQEAEECADSRLVYIGITWDMWEPRQGEYDIEGLEETFHLKRWKEENKHAVLRFICDLPGEEGHMDIPRWLYEKTRDGEFYDMPRTTETIISGSATVWRSRRWQSTATRMILSLMWKSAVWVTGENGIPTRTKGFLCCRMPRCAGNMCWIIPTISITPV